MIVLRGSRETATAAFIALGWKVRGSPPEELPDGTTLHPVHSNGEAAVGKVCITSGRPQTAQRFSLPQGAAIYVLKGVLKLNGETYTAGTLIWIPASGAFNVDTTRECTLGVFYPALPGLTGP